MRDFTPVCPIPLSDYPHVLLAHGGGGRLMNLLINRMFVATFANPLINQAHDGAVFAVNQSRLAFTTDSYVVKPLFFPGGDIGKLAVHGTVNDLAMCGARPYYLSLGLILEEGLAMAALWQIVQSIAQAAQEAHVVIATGDTKVVDKGSGDGIFINTAGIGIIEHDIVIAPRSVQKGDVVILSGDIGRHGIAIMASREGLAFDSPILSDSAPLAEPILQLLAGGIRVHCLRDLTRGGLASGLIEIAQTADKHIQLDERAIPIDEAVQGACELLGLDPLYIANEGRFVAFVPPHQVDTALAILHSNPNTVGAVPIGIVDDNETGLVTMRSVLGATRIIDLLAGEQLPRIC